MGSWKIKRVRYAGQNRVHVHVIRRDGPDRVTEKITPLEMSVPDFFSAFATYREAIVEADPDLASELGATLDSTSWLEHRDVLQAMPKPLWRDGKAIGLLVPLADAEQYTAIFSEPWEEVQSSYPTDDQFGRSFAFEFKDPGAAERILTDIRAERENQDSPNSLASFRIIKGKTPIGRFVIGSQSIVFDGVPVTG